MSESVMPEPDPQPLNPYAPTASTLSDQDDLSRGLYDEDDYVPASFAWTAFRWFMVCFVSTVPSFLVGMAVTEARWQGMIAGILIFAIGYTFADYLTSGQTWRKNKLIRRTLKVMYGTRVAISIIFPVGSFLDIFCGMVTMSVSQAFAGTGLARENAVTEFSQVLFMTLVQGCVLNVVLCVYGLVILTFSLIVIQLRR